MSDHEKSRRVEILEAKTVRVGRAQIDFPKGWTGRVVHEAFTALMEAGAAKEVASVAPEGVAETPASIEPE